ncbi:MAG: TetR/AcrR family transcriptional regulator [Planctomycetota bacterium]
MLALTDLFREQGFEGATLTMISKATGLKRASLYHRFPGGKQDMELAVTDFTASEFQEVLAPLHGPGDVKTRIRKVARLLGEYYDDGLRTCLIDSLSVGKDSEGRDVLSGRIAEIMEAFIASFEQIAKESGASTKEARLRAEDAVVRFEGSLVVARSTEKTGSFKRWQKDLPRLLTGE